MRKSGTIYFLAALLFSWVSCTDKSVSNSPEASVNSLTLGEFNVLYNDIKLDGTDTILVRKVTNGTVAFDIDHINNQIYNTEKLPFGSVINKITTNITATGTPYFQLPDSAGEMHTILWTKDVTIDLRTPVTILVKSDDGSYTRKYTLTANVYSANPDSMTWKKCTEPMPADMNCKDAIELDGRILVFGMNGAEEPCVTATDISGTGKWSDLQICSGLDNEVDFRTMTRHGELLAVLDGGSLFTSPDGIVWTDAQADTRLSSLIRFRQDSDGGTAWALTSDGWIASSEDLSTWTAIQEAGSMFPTSDISAECYPLGSNTGILRYVLTGSCTNAGYAPVWTRLSTEDTWSLVETSSDHSLRCPAFNRISMFRYDGRLYTFGGQGFSGSKEVPAMHNFYESRDNGITWRECKSIRESYNTWNNYMQIPEAFRDSDEPCCFVTDHNSVLWFISSDLRGIWRGYINRLHID